MNQKIFHLNDVIEFNFELRSTAKMQQKIVVDYVVHHVKANKETTPKVFKLKKLVLEPNQQVSIFKKHPLKLITTRKYYSGSHLLEIQVNGKILASTKWTLKV